MLSYLFSNEFEIIQVNKRKATFNYTLYKLLT